MSELAREILAAEYERADMPACAEAVRGGSEQYDVELNAVTAALQQSDSTAGWQPIASAPKDGTEYILGWIGKNLHGEAEWYQAIGRWSTDLKSHWNYDLDELEYDGGWTDYTVADWGMQEYTELEPTHWRQLPAPPSDHLPPSALKDRGR